MAFTKAAEVANLVKRHVLPGVVISLGKAQGAPGIEVVVKGFSHPEDGMSRVWHIHLLGQSGMMLDLIIRGLRKAGFEMSGSAPLMRGRLTQVLSRAEVAQMRQAQRDTEREKKEQLVKAEIQATATVAQATNNEIEVLRAELDRLKEMLEDMALMPTPRGPRGPAGADGKDGADAIANLESAVLGDIGDVSDEEPLDRMVLTWKDGKWRPWRAPFRSISQIHAAGGGGGGEGSVGPQGPQGEPGADGLSAYQLAVNAGFVGTEQEWLDSLQGEAGQTAYELAVEQGFEGTQEEWIESLRGEDGEDGTGGSGSLTVQQRDRDNMSAAPTGTITNISTLSFDTDSGFEVVDLGNGTQEAFVKLNSTFNPWFVDGQTTLDATGEEPVEFVGGPGVTITTDATTDPKQIIFETSGGADGGIPEAPQDSRYYVRFNGTWVDLQTALAHLMVGDGGAFSPEADGGDFAAGASSTVTSQVFDGGDFTTGASDATDNQMVEGTDVSDPYFGTVTGPENYN